MMTRLFRAGPPQRSFPLPFDCHAARPPYYLGGSACTVGWTARVAGEGLATDGEPVVTPNSADHESVARALSNERPYGEYVR